MLCNSLYNLRIPFVAPRDARSLLVRFRRNFCMILYKAYEKTIRILTLIKMIKGEIQRESFKMLHYGEDTDKSQWKFTPFVMEIFRIIFALEIQFCYWNKSLKSNWFANVQWPQN